MELFRWLSGSDFIAASNLVSHSLLCLVEVAYRHPTHAPRPASRRAARRGQRPAPRPRRPRGWRMPRLLVAHRPCVTRGLAVEQLSQAGDGQFARRPVVEQLESRLDDADIQQVPYAVFGPQVGREVIAERVAIGENPGKRQEY